MNERRDELLETIRALLDQLADESEAALPRVTSALATTQYLEALTRSLVDEAHDQGASWDDLGHVFGTTAANVKARFGAYRQYDDPD